MTLRQGQHNWMAWIAAIASGWWILSPTLSLAQITGDNTLGSAVNDSLTIPCTGQCTINGGTVRGVNLYHSFQEFSIPTGGQAWFNNAPTIQNILTRVTGTTVSNIDGLIRTNGTTNLFLLNPNGVIFGPNAQLQIGGSFQVSTANSFRLADGSEFRAAPEQVPPLLTVDISPGLQAGANLTEATIINRGQLVTGQNLTLNATRLDLQGSLQAGNQLTLQATDTVRIRDTEGAAFSARSGGDLTIQGNQGIDILTLNHPTQTPFISTGNLNLISNGEIATDAHFLSGGNITIAPGDRTINPPAEVQLVSRQDPIFNATDNFNLPIPYEGLSLLVNAGGDINFGAVTITGVDPAIAPTPAFLLNAGGAINGTGDIRTTAANGNLLVNIQAQGDVRTRAITTRGGDLTINSQTGTITTGELATHTNLSTDPLDGGDVTLTAQGTITTGTIDSFSEQLGQVGNGGNIIITSRTGRVTTGQLFSYAETERNNSPVNAPNSRAGNVSINANTGIGISTTGGAGILTKAPGQGGTVQLSTTTGNIAVGAFLFITSSEQQNAGNVTLTTGAGNISIQPRLITTGEQQGGDVTLTTGQGNITTQLIRTTAITERGGDVVLSASQGRINVAALATNESNPSNLPTQSDAGDITIFARNGVQAGAIDAFSLSGRNAGNVQITTTRGDITAQQIFAYVEGVGGTAQGGNVSLNVAEAGNIRVSIPIATYSTRNAGDVNIETNQGNINLGPIVATSNNETIANPTGEELRGGNVWLKTNRGSINAEDIVVFSQNGTGGSINAFAQGGNLSLHGAFTLGTQSGAVNLNATGDITINTINATSRQGSGKITITSGGTFWANLLRRRNGIRYSAVLANDTFGPGNAGEIQINARSLVLAQGAQISSSTHSTGTGGNIAIQATDQIDIGGLIPRNLGIRPGTEASIGLAGLPAGTNLGGFVPTGDNTNVDPAKVDYPAGIYTQTTTQSLGQAGNIVIKTPLLTVREGGVVGATTFGQGNSGSVVVDAGDGRIEVQGGKIQSGVGAVQSGGSSGSVTLNARSLTVTQGGLVQTQTLGRGTAGAMEITADTVNLTGVGSTIRSGSGDPLIQGGAVGAGGDLRLQVRSLTVADSATLSAETFTNARGGDIFVTGATLDLQTSGQLRTSTFGAGAAGSMALTFSDRLWLSDPGTGLFANTELGSTGSGGSIALTVPTTWIQNQAGIAVDSRSSGSGGSIQIRTAMLDLNSRGYITAETTGTGNAGTIDIQANQVQLTGNGTGIRSGSGNDQTPNLQAGSGGDIRVTSQTLALSQGASLSAQTFSSAAGGNVVIQGDTLIAQTQGQIRTTTLGAGPAGNIVLRLGDRLQLSDPGTGLFADTALGSTGNGGSIFIDPPTVLIKQGAGVGVGSRGTGQGGNLEIRADKLTLDQHAFLTAETASAQGGNITLEMAERLFLRRNSTISATAGTAQLGGNGGNITIRAPFIIGVLNENSDIIANAFTGRGGNITITTNGIYGLRFQPQLTLFSDITASSQFGLSGTVTLNLLNVDPSRGLVALPINLTDPAQQISQTCQPGAKTATSSFVATGRGGIPLSPEEPLESRTGGARWVPLPETEGREGSPTDRQAVGQAPSSTDPWVEANELIQGRDRGFELVAPAPGQHRLAGFTPATCEIAPQR